MISEKNNEQEWDLILYPGKSGLISEIKELWQYRELILLLVKKEFKIMYAQTILGPVWLLLTPLMSSAVLSLVFGMAAGISTDGIFSKALHAYQYRVVPEGALWHTIYFVYYLLFFKLSRLWRSSEDPFYSVDIVPPSGDDGPEPGYRNFFRSFYCKVQGYYGTH